MTTLSCLSYHRWGSLAMNVTDAGRRAERIDGPRALEALPDCGASCLVAADLVEVPEGDPVRLDQSGLGVGDAVFEAVVADDRLGAA